MADAFDIVRADMLAAVPHGFFGHAGGRHQFGYGGEGEPRRIALDREGAAQAILGSAVLVAPHQVHSPDAAIVTEPWPDTPEGRPVGDAVVTDRPGLALGIVTADCAPVLLADRTAGVVAAAHAGWRGAIDGVLENTVAAMKRLGAVRQNIAAAIGPCIAQASYEVGADMRANFPEEDWCFFAPGQPDHWQFDLAGFAARQLERAGVEQIERLGLDTYALEQRFYSYRRATHRGEPNYGRQLSVIALH